MARERRRPRRLPLCNAGEDAGVPGLFPLQQFLQHIYILARVDDRNRPIDAGRVVLALVVDAQNGADRAEEIGNADRAVDHRGAILVGLADDLASLDAAADEHAAPCLGPMIASAAGAL